MKFGKICAAACVAGGLWSGAASATPVTLDFEGFFNPPGGPGINTFGQTIAEDGFVLNTGAVFGGFASYSPSSVFYTGSVAMFANQSISTVVLTQDGGGAFSIGSIALATTNGLASGTPLVFTGVRSDTGIVQQAFSFDGTLQVFGFLSGFTDLVSLSWTQDPSNNVQFDNIVVDGDPVAVSAPVPAALLALLVPALFAARRARPRHTA